jgi:hypothetical protein
MRGAILSFFFVLKIILILCLIYYMGTNIIIDVSYLRLRRDYNERNIYRKNRCKWK